MSHKQESRRLRDDDSAAGKDKARGNIQLVGEHGELVGPPVAVGVLADFDAVVALAGRLDVMGVVARLRDPTTAAFVPRHGDGLGDVGFGGKRDQLQVGRHLGALHAAAHGERMLEGDGLGPVLVVGDRRARLAPLGFARGQKSLPLLAARFPDGVEQAGFGQNPNSGFRRFASLAGKSIDTRRLAAKQRVPMNPDSGCRWGA